MLRWVLIFCFLLAAAISNAQTGILHDELSEPSKGVLSQESKPEQDVGDPVSSYLKCATTVTGTKDHATFDEDCKESHGWDWMVFWTACAAIAAAVGSLAPLTGVFLLQRTLKQGRVIVETSRQSAKAANSAAKSSFRMANDARELGELQTRGFVEIQAPHTTLDVKDILSVGIRITNPGPTHVRNLYIHVKTCFQRDRNDLRLDENLWTNPDATEAGQILSPKDEIFRQFNLTADLGLTGDMMKQIREGKAKILVIVCAIYTDVFKRDRNCLQKITINDRTLETGKTAGSFGWIDQDIAFAN